MENIYNILNFTCHRPFALPNRESILPGMEQGAVFSLGGSLCVRARILTGIHLDGLIFSIDRFISDFHEINLNTYINNNNKKGMYVLSIEAEKLLSKLIARNLSGFPMLKPSSVAPIIYIIPEMPDRVSFSTPNLKLKKNWKPKQH